MREGFFPATKSTSTCTDSVILAEDSKAVGSVNVVAVRADDLALHYLVVMGEDIGQDQVRGVVGALGLFVVGEDIG